MYSVIFRCGMERVRKIEMACKGNGNSRVYIVTDQVNINGLYQNRYVLDTSSLQHARAAYVGRIALALCTNGCEIDC